VSDDVILPTNQLHAIGLLVAGHSVADTASACDVTPRTVYRWKNTPEFRAAMGKASEIIMEEGTSYSRAAFTAAWRDLTDYAHNSESTLSNERILNLIRIVREAVRTRDVFERIAENREILQRIRELEHSGDNGNGRGRAIPFWQRAYGEEAS
jgi:hypothetical protein